MEAQWVQVLPRLREQVGERNFTTWIEPIRCCRDENGLRLEVESRFIQEWVTRHFLEQIRAALAQGEGCGAAVRVVIAASAGEPTRRTAPAPAPRRVAPARPPQIGRLVPDYTFETFVVGHANQVAYQAARSVAQMSARRFNPLFLWGGVGLGKTHLVNALAHATLAQSPRRRLAVLSAETFMNTLIAALRKDQMGVFRDRFRQLDMLILDDVEFLAGKERTQEEFFHTFNALHAAGRQIVLTSDNPPHVIAAFEHRLRSRFEGGLIADIRPPSRDMRLAIATRKAAAQGVDLPAAVADVVVDCSGPSVRELEGALTRVLASASLQGAPLTEEMARQVLAPVTPTLNVITIEAIQAVVAEHFHLSPDDLRSHRRARSLAFARQVAMYLSRSLTQASFPFIAEKFGGRDHSTVMYAVRTLEEKGTTEPGIAHLLRALEGELRGRTGPHLP